MAQLLTPLSSYGGAHDGQQLRNVHGARYRDVPRQGERDHVADGDGDCGRLTCISRARTGAEGVRRRRHSRGAACQPRLSAGVGSFREKEGMMTDFVQELTARVPRLASCANDMRMAFDVLVECYRGEVCAMTGATPVLSPPLPSPKCNGRSQTEVS